jgi:beta-1,4-mannosyltransferase
MAWPAFSLESSNPYCSLLYRAMQKRGAEVVEIQSIKKGLPKRIDILHIHWPDTLLNARSWWSALSKAVRLKFRVRLARLCGARLVWTAHNLQSHENYHPVLERMFWRMFAAETDGVISLSNAGLDKVREKRLGKREIPAVVIPHGHYRDVYPNDTNGVKSRQRLGISPNVFVVGWVGQIRAYKGLEELVDIWQKCHATKRALLIAGYSPEPALRELLEQSAREDPSVHFQHGRVENNDLQYYFNAADVMVLPYRKILNSGSTLLGLSFNRPVALPRSEVMMELQSQVGGDWIYLYDGPFSEGTLQDIITWAQHRPQGATASLDALEWSLIADKTLTFFQEVISK